MTLIEKSYEVDGVRLTGFLADGSRGARVPGILVAHEAPGITNQLKSKAMRDARETMQLLCCARGLAKPANLLRR